jgi:hypothetical protein
VKHVRVGRHVQVLVVDRFFHAQVTAVADQDTVDVSIGDDAPVTATRLADPPSWRVNCFATGD